MNVKTIFICIIFLSAAIKLYGQNQFYQINSSTDEQAPVMHPSGDLFYFTRANDTANIGGRKDKGDIYVSHKKENGVWSPPENLGKPVNNESYNAVAGFSPDGKVMFLHHHYTPSGNPGAFTGISYTVKNEGSWAVPKKIDIDYFLNKSTHQSGSLTANGKYLLLSMESYGTRGAEDIYVCFYDGKKFSQPANLGSTINTEFQEMAPYLAADEETLYFSSNGHGGQGGRDIFVSRRLDDTWRNWSVPKNLGTSINTEGVELYFYLYENGDKAFYTTTQNSDGYADINSYTLPENERIEPVPGMDSTVFTVENEAEVDVKEVSSGKIFRGNIINTKSGERIEAEVILQSEVQDTTIQASARGGFHVNLRENISQAEILVKANGFMPVQDDIILNNREESKNYFLTPLEVGATIKLKKVYFHRGEATLIDSSFAELKRIVDVMNDHPGMEIELAGHTDNRGDANKNLKLSQKRAEKVKQYLVKNGIDENRITGKGYGGSRPIASNASEETRKLNRRVEFIITKK